MKKAQYTILILAILALFACSTVGLQKPVSVCDSTRLGDSVLCDLANQYDLHLETVGDLLLIINLRAIQKGSYKPSDALEVLGDIETLLALSPSPDDLKSLVAYHVIAYPELILLSPYLSYMNVPTPITAKDADMLRWWIGKNRELLK
jgi:hypothetical protein